MGFLTRPSINQVDPNTPTAQGVQSGFADLLGELMGGFDVGSGGASDLQRMGTDAIGALLNANPEQQVLDQLSPGLMDIFGRNTAEAVGEAAFPLFQRSLQEGIGTLASSAPSRFSTAFDQQGIGLGQRAIQDFNLLTQQAFQQNVGNQLGAAGLLGTLAGQAGEGAFGRAATATQLGTAATQADPRLQLLLAGLGAFRPAQQDTVVGDSPLGAITNVGTSLLTLGALGGLPFGGEGGGLPIPAHVLRPGAGVTPSVHDR